MAKPSRMMAHARGEGVNRPPRQESSRGMANKHPVATFFGALVALAAFFVPFGTHIWWCIERADETGSAVALLFVGFFVFPLGWLHGVSVLLGFGGWI